MVLMMVSIAALSRSHNHSKLAKLLTIYFKSCGMSTKAFDTLHALGITMSQKWVYSAIDQLSQTVRTAMMEDMKKFPWFGSHDNLNLPFKVYDQRINNQSHFDSGTAATLFIIKDPHAIRPSMQELQQQRALGARNPITLVDILKLEMDASYRHRSRAISHVLTILKDTPAFDFQSYEGKDHRVFAGAIPVRILPSGREYATCQYMLNTVHIEEASYDGNDRVLQELWRQLGITNPEAKKALSTLFVTPWVGDQLTASRIWGLQLFRSGDLNCFDRLEFLIVLFGLFHAQIAYEHSLHTQYYGTPAGFGLIQAFDLLKRKSLHSPSVQGNFHHHIKEALYHIAEARIRDLWCTVAQVTDLSELRDRTPAQLHKLATKIVDKHASTAALNEMKKGKDDLLYQSTQFARDLLDYIDFDRAIKFGDVGCIEDHLPRLLFRFAGGSNKNYTKEVLELMQGLYRDWPADLR